MHDNFDLGEKKGGETREILEGGKITNASSAFRPGREREVFYYSLSNKKRKKLAGNGSESSFKKRERKRKGKTGQEGEGQLLVPRGNDSPTEVKKEEKGREVASMKKKEQTKGTDILSLLCKPR